MANRRAGAVTRVGRATTTSMQWVHALHDQQGSLAIVAGFSRVTSSFANRLSRLLVIVHGDERAMPQVPGISPFDECDVADQFRRDPAALLHFLRATIRPTARPLSRADS
jgi:hypothetical protein